MDVVTAPQENRKPGVNPGRYRRCMRGGTTLDESRSLGKPEKAVWSLGCVSQKNCLNEVKTLGSASTEPVVFCCGKTAAATQVLGCCSFFAVTVCVGLIPLDLLIALAVTARKPTEYCLSMRCGDPVRNRNNRPLLCLASPLAISQRASRVDWVYHALTGECSLIYPYLRINRLHFFICGKTT